VPLITSVLAYWACDFGEGSTFPGPNPLRLWSLIESGVSMGLVGKAATYGLRGAKTLTQMADEIGTTKSTVRRWLRRDHWGLWMEYWASAEEIWEVSRQDRERRPEDRAKRPAEGLTRKAMLADLDRALTHLMIGGQVDAMA